MRTVLIGGVVLALAVGGFLLRDALPPLLMPADTARDAPAPVVQTAQPPAPTATQPVREAPAPVVPTDDAPDALADAPAAPPAPAAPEEPAPATATPLAEPDARESDLAAVPPAPDPVSAPEAPAPLAEAPAPPGPPPAFDVVRVATDGGTLVAGAAAPGATVILRVDGDPVAEAVADGAGQFVAMFRLQPTDDPQTMTLESRTRDGVEMAAGDMVILSPRPDVAVAALAPEGPGAAPADAGPVPPAGAGEVPDAIATRAGDDLPVLAALPPPDAPQTEAEAAAPALEAGAPAAGLAATPDVAEAPAVAPEAALVAEAAPDAPDALAQPEAVFLADDAEMQDPPAIAPPAAAEAEPPVDALPPPERIAAIAPMAADAPEPATEALPDPQRDAQAAAPGLAPVRRPAPPPVQGAAPRVGDAPPPVAVRDPAAATTAQPAEDLPPPEAQAAAPAPGLQTPAAPGAPAGVAQAPALAPPDAAPQVRAPEAVAAVDAAPEPQPVAEEPLPQVGAAAAEPALPPVTEQAAVLPPAFVLRQTGAVEVPGAPQPADAVVIDAISYAGTGEVQISGRAGRDDPAARVQLYLDNQPLALAQSERGTWSVAVPDLAPGLYTLRADQLAGDGRVSTRFETPFQRATPEEIERARPAGDVPPSVQLVVVQPGNSLWRISRAHYGEGIRYVQIYQANLDQIRDPDLIYPGQIFVLPEDELGDGAGFEK